MVKDLNRIIVSSLNKNGWGHKLSDDAQNFTGTSQKPFDYFGVTYEFMIFGESKLIKGGISSFNFHKIKPHQIDSLKRIRSYVKNTLEYENCHTVISVGFWKSRKFFYVVFIDIAAILLALSVDKISIKQKEIQAIIDSGKYLEIKKGELQDITNLSNKIIYDFLPFQS